MAQRSGQMLSEVSNAMVAAHRRHFGRGPGAARTLAVDSVMVCVLSDVYTRVERKLIEAGQADHVREARRLHHQALSDEYVLMVAAIVGRPVAAFLTVTHVDPDVAVATFLLEDEDAV